jgi:hypothetical protein
MKSNKLGINPIVALLTLQIWFVDVFSISGIIYREIFSSPSDNANFEIFSNNETFTSVVESFRIDIIGGNIYSMISYF